MSQAGRSTSALTPSDEVDRKQLELAGQEGQTYYDALQYMVDEVAHTGGEQQAGDYIVAFAQEEAEGMYRFEDGKLEWMEPGDKNCHFEVAVLDATDRRFLPHLDVYLTVIDSDGNEVGTHEMPFLWHPGLFHYGRNWKLPGKGTYTLRIRVEPPRFFRHDKKNGKRYEKPVEVVFEDVHVKTGQD